MSVTPKFLLYDTRSNCTRQHFLLEVVRLLDGCSNEEAYR